MRNLIIGIILGVAVALAFGATTWDTGRYQIAVTSGHDLWVFRIDTQTGAVEACGYPPSAVPSRTLIQIIQPR